MRRIALLSASLLLLVAAPAPASAASMPASTHRAISKLIDSFVKDVILRRNLAAGWALVGPDMRGGTTRKAWDRGTGVTAQAFPAEGTDFSNSWDGKLDSPGKAEITVNLRSAGKNAEVIAAPTVVLKEHGRWVVDIFYIAGIFRTGSGHKGSCAHANCAVTGINDFGPGSSAPAFGLLPRDRALWFWVALGGVGGVLFATLGSLLLYTRLRDRRALQAYEAHMGRR
jgi:hypothetical protein